MNYTIYKPNAKNSGSAFSFDLTTGKNDTPVIFVNMILQYSWNDQYKNGSFKENAKNPEKSAVFALTPTEAGEIISSVRSRVPFTAFHKKDDNTTIINFTPWDKKRKIRGKDGDQFFETPAFGLSVAKNSSQKFSLPLEAGETEMLVLLLEEYIKWAFDAAARQYKPREEGGQSNNRQSNNSKPQEKTKLDDDFEDDGVPF